MIWDCETAAALIRADREAVIEKVRHELLRQGRIDFTAIYDILNTIKAEIGGSQ
jgi:hypothetical protein